MQISMWNGWRKKKGIASNHDVIKEHLANLTSWKTH